MKFSCGVVVALRLALIIRHVLNFLPGDGILKSLNLLKVIFKKKTTIFCLILHFLLSCRNILGM
jgi:hypothetical protein